MMIIMIMIIIIMRSHRVKFRRPSDLDPFRTSYMASKSSNLESSPSPMGLSKV